MLWILLLGLWQSCHFLSTEPASLEDLKQTRIQLQSGEVIETRMAITSAEQTQGLSGVQADDFQDHEAMLFFNLYDDTRYFWMPDTYFDLDLFYLNAELVIIDIDRNLPHYVGRENPDSIPRARPIYCRHVLEMKATSPLAKKIQIGDKLTWKGPYSLEQTTQGIRRYR